MVDDLEAHTVIDGIKYVTHTWFVEGCPHGLSYDEQFNNENCNLEFGFRCMELCGPKEVKNE